MKVSSLYPALIILLFWPVLIQTEPTVVEEIAQVETNYRDVRFVRTIASWVWATMYTMDYEKVWQQEIPYYYLQKK